MMVIRPKGLGEEAIEDANLDREDSALNADQIIRDDAVAAAGRRVQDLLRRNNEEVMTRRDLERRLEEQKILVEALLMLIRSGALREEKT